MVKATNKIDHVVGEKTIAAFVEQDSFLQILRELGVDYGELDLLIDDLPRIKTPA